MQNNHSSDALFQQIVSRLKIAKRNTDGSTTAWCIFHPDGQGNPPHQANLRVSEKGFYCFACKAKGSLRKLARHLGLETSFRFTLMDFSQVKKLPVEFLQSFGLRD